MIPKRRTITSFQRLVAVAWLLLPIAACRDAAPMPASGATREYRSARRPGRTPLDRLNQLREYHRLRQYQRIEQGVTPDCRNELTRLLVTADRLLAANRQAMRLVRRTGSATLAERCNLAPVADSLGIFSANIKPLDTTYSEKHAVVHYQVGNVLPLRKAVFVQRHDRWLYQPDTIPGLGEKIGDLAHALARLVAALENQNPTKQRIDHEYRTRIIPIIRQLADLVPPESKTASTKLSPQQLSAASIKR